MSEFGGGEAPAEPRSAERAPAQRELRPPDLAGTAGRRSRTCCGPVLLDESTAYQSLRMAEPDCGYHCSIAVIRSPVFHNFPAPQYSCLIPCGSFFGRLPPSRAVAGFPHCEGAVLTE